jgi:hypothetical protein
MHHTSSLQIQGAGQDVAATVLHVGRQHQPHLPCIRIQALYAAPVALMLYRAVLWYMLCSTIDQQAVLLCCAQYWYGSPIALAGVRLLLPQPEFDYFEAAARAASSFVVEIRGELVAHGSS